MPNLFSFLAAHPAVPLFLFTNLVIGLWAHRKTKAGSFADYAWASKDLPVGVLIMTVLATVLYSNDLSCMDIAIEFGIITPVMAFLAFVLFALLIGTFFAPQLIFFEKNTQGGVMGSLYGEWVQLFTGWVQLFFSLAILAAQIATIGALSKDLLGIDFTTAVLFFGGIVVLYSTLGGMRAVSYTDVFQLITILLVFFWMAQKAMFKSGGIAELIRAAASDAPEKLSILDHPDLPMRIRAQVYWTFATVMSPPVMHRMLMVHDKSSVSKMWYTTPFIYGAVMAMMILIALFGIVHYKALKLVEGHTLLAHTLQDLFSGQPWVIDTISIGMIGILLSTMDSFLHTLGITLVEDIIKPMKNLLGHKDLTEHKQMQYAKILIFVTGVLAIFIGSQVEGIGPLSIGHKLIVPAIVLQGLVSIPLIIGVMGLKTDKHSFLSFAITYLSVFSIQKFLIPWRTHLAHRANYDYFFVALPLGIFAYLIVHILRNKGIATVKRGDRYAAEQLWIPTWQGFSARIANMFKATFNLPALARKQVSQRPLQSLSFSILIFTLYALQSAISGNTGRQDAADFMAVIYFIGITLCCGLMLEGVWPKALQPYLPLYWLITLFYCLPLGGTLAFLRMHEGLSSAFFFVGGFVVLALLVSSRAFVAMSLWGTVLAWSGWYVMVGQWPGALWEETYVGGYVALCLLVLCVLSFGHGSEVHIAEKLYMNEAFSHAMTHETTQPLTEIAILSGFHNKIASEFTPMQNKQGEKGFWVPAETQTMIEQGSEQVSKAVQKIKKEFSRFNQLLGKEIGSMVQEKASIQSLIKAMLPKFPQKYTERVKIEIECIKDFEATLIPSLFINVFVNLLKNAYLHGGATSLKIQIDGTQRKISIQDNGKGIPVDILPHIFKLRFTTRKITSDGVGLALVKLILDASKIKIDCYTKHGKNSFTEFVLSFPHSK